MDHRDRRGATSRGRTRAVLAADPLAAEQCPECGGAFRQGQVGMAGEPAAQTIRTLFSAEAIAERVGSLAREIAAASPRDLVIVAILKGSFIFAADLIRALHREGLRPEIDFIFLASYGGGTGTGGEPRGFRERDRALPGRAAGDVQHHLGSRRTPPFAHTPPSPGRP